MKQLIFFKHRSPVWAIVVATAMLALIGGCHSAAEKQPSESLTAHKRSIYTLREGKVTLTREYPARIEGKVNVDVRAQAEGYVEKIFVDEGEQVRTGQSLFKIADAPYREQVRTAQAALNAAQAEQKRAALEVEKFTELSKSKVTSDFQLKTARAAFEAAAATVASQQAAVATARINLGFTVVKAPVSGLIGRIPKRIGNLVSRTDTEPLTTLSNINQVYAYFSITEQDFLGLSRSSSQPITSTLTQLPPVGLVLADGKPYPQKGTIQTVDGKFDTGTGSISVRAMFANPRYLLRSGSTGRIVLPEHRQHSLLVPVQATADIQNKLYVFRLSADNRAERVAITVSGKTGDSYILREGLKTGDRIIAKDATLVTEGELVRP